MKTIPNGGLHQILSMFARDTGGWHFPRDKSEDYQRGHGNPAGFVICVNRDQLPPAAVAVANVDANQPRTFQVPNIVPRECSSLSLDEYNGISRAFTADFAAWLKSSSLGGNVETVGPVKTLTDIIRGEKSRKFFEAWVRTPTPLSHPSDLHALNIFICHLFRHPGKTRTYEIESYLVSDLNWTRGAARAAVARIDAGLELLRVDRRF
jgi:hypothetical protein